MESKVGHYNISSNRASVNHNPSVGEFGPDDDTIHVTGLEPGHYYNIRVITTNAAEFSTFGPLIRLRTSPALPTGMDPGTVFDDKPVNNLLEENAPATIHATPSHFDSTLPSTSHQAILQEFSGNQNNNRRAPSGQRGAFWTCSAGNPPNSVPHSGSKNDIEVEGVIKQLTEKLEISRREQQDVDRQMSEEENESKRVMAEIIKERDGLKQILKEKEETSSELRKQGNHLDKLNRTAQSRKAAKEKILQQKKAERQKMEDDIVRWNKEISEIGRDTQEMMNEKTEITTAKDLDVAEVRKGISEHQAWIKSLEEDIRIKGIQIKEIEKTREKPDLPNADQRRKANKELEENPQMMMLLHNLQQVRLPSPSKTIFPSRLHNTVSNRESASPGTASLVDGQACKRSRAIRT